MEWAGESTQPIPFLGGWRNEVVGPRWKAWSWMPEGGIQLQRSIWETQKHRQTQASRFLGPAQQGNGATVDIFEPDARRRHPDPAEGRQSQ